MIWSDADPVEFATDLTLAALVGVPMHMPLDHIHMLSCEVAHCTDVPRMKLLLKNEIIIHTHIYIHMYENFKPAEQT